MTMNFELVFVEKIHATINTRVVVVAKLDGVTRKALNNDKSPFFSQGHAAQTTVGSSTAKKQFAT